MKSERIKKLESELQDLEQWMHLGLVPKSDLEKHKAEIKSIKQKIQEEEDRLRDLKENGDMEEYVAPKKAQGGRQAYQEPHTLPGIEEEPENFTESGFTEGETYETETTSSGTEETKEEPSLIDEEEDDPFSDRNRWRRGVLEDPDRDDW